MENYKKIIPGFGCRNGEAVFIEGGKICQGGSVLPLCRHYSDNGGDEIFLYDASETEEDHDRTIGIMKEAVREMELVGHTFFVFRNGETDEVNVVYKRKDGSYGLIEPEY